MHLPWPDHETGAEAQVRQHRQYHRNETEERADYQGMKKGSRFYITNMNSSE